MPENARVFVAEDDPDFLDDLKMVLEGEGHAVTLSATSLENALQAIGNFQKLGIQVASIDGNLKRGVRSGTDGRQLVNAIRDLAPDVKIIGMSAEPITGVDVDLGKDRFEELGQVVTGL